MAKVHAVHAHVLVAGEHEVEVKLPADAAGLVLAAFGKRLAGFQVALKAAVIDQHGHVALRPDRLQRAGAGVHGVLDDQLCNRLRVLPAPDEGRARADEADAQPVAQPVNGVRRDGQQAVPVTDVAAQALRVQLVQVVGQSVDAVVEVMIAQRHKLIARQVHHRGDGMAAVGVVCQTAPPLLLGQAVKEVGQRRALNGVAAVEDERIAVVREVRCQLHQAHRPFLPVGVVGGKEIAVRIRGEADAERLVHREAP